MGSRRAGVRLPSPSGTQDGGTGQGVFSFLWLHLSSFDGFLSFLRDGLGPSQHQPGTPAPHSEAEAQREPESWGRSGSGLQPGGATQELPWGRPEAWDPLSPGGA